MLGASHKGNNMIHSSNNGRKLISRISNKDLVSDFLSEFTEDNFSFAEALLTGGALDNRESIRPLLFRNDAASRRLLLMVLRRNEIRLKAEDVELLFKTYQSLNFNPQDLPLLIESVCSSLSEANEQQIYEWFKYPSPTMARALNFLHDQGNVIPGFAVDRRVRIGTIPGARLVLNTASVPGSKPKVLVSLEDHAGHTKLTIEGQDPLKTLKQEEVILSLRISNSFNIPDQFSVELTVGRMRILLQEFMKNLQVVPARTPTSTSSGLSIGI